MGGADVQAPRSPSAAVRRLAPNQNRSKNPMPGTNQAARIGRDDPRYRTVVDKQFNKRFRAKPDYVCSAKSTNDVVSALQDAVDAGLRVVATSGGHCLEA